MAQGKLQTPFAAYLARSAQPSADALSSAVRSTDFDVPSWPTSAVSEVQFSPSRGRSIHVGSTAVFRANGQPHSSIGVWTAHVHRSPKPCHEEPKTDFVPARIRNSQTSSACRLSFPSGNESVSRYRLFGRTLISALANTLRASRQPQAG